ncbi:MAG: hypothetical protein JHC38_09895 [Thiotrichales bacterium]|jgi:hypothetical protein|nr:hypothetical protein [Thiotrichales bacterium]
MTKRKFTINLFNLTKNGPIPLNDLLVKINKVAISRRNRDIGHDVKLEDIIAPTTAKPYWLLNFSKLRDFSPGKGSKTGKTTALPYAKGDAPSEETAMLYQPDTGYIALQYNHYGLRAESIAEYLGVFDHKAPNQYALNIMLNQDAIARLDSKQIFTRIEIKVAVKGASFLRQNGFSLGSAIENSATSSSADIVAIELASDLKNKTGLSVPSNLISIFKSLATNHTASVHTLKVSGRDYVDGKIDTVNLIEEKVSLDYYNVKRDAGLRLDLQDRFRHLEKAYLQWKSDGYFK